MSLRAEFLREVAAAGLSHGPAPAEPVTDADLDALPEPARRYLRFMGVPGRPRDWSFRAGFLGRFRQRPDAPWFECEAWQYNTRLGIARLFHMQMKIAGVLPVVGRDSYANGHGRMRIRLLDRFTLGDSSGEEFDLGELVTWLNDGVMIAPSMLLVPQVRWIAQDADSFDLALTDAERTVQARVVVNAVGAPVNFHTTDRFLAPTRRGEMLRRLPWSTPVEGWRRVDDRMQFGAGRAVWDLEGREFTYIEMRPIPGSRSFNIAPGE